MSLAKDGIKGLLTETEDRLQSAVQTEIKDAEKRLCTEIKSVEKRLDERITEVEKRLDGKIDGVEERLEKKIESERNILQIFFDQQLRKTNGLIEDVAQQLKITQHAITHTLDKQAVLEEHVEAVEQQVSLPL